MVVLTLCQPYDFLQIKACQKSLTTTYAILILYYNNNAWTTDETVFSMFKFQPHSKTMNSYQIEINISNVWTLYMVLEIYICVCVCDRYSLGKLNILNDHVVENFTSGYCFPGPFLLTWINNHIPSNMSDEIAYVFTYIKDTAVEVWEWISNFMSHVTWYVITYPCCFDWNLSIANERGPRCSLFYLLVT